MTIAVRPLYQATGANNPNKQISVTRWNDGSALTGAAGASILFDQDGAAFDSEMVVNVFAFMTGAERAAVQAGGFTVNVTDAFTAASARLQALGSGTLLIPPGDYLVGKQTFGGTALDGVTQVAYGPQEIITVKTAGNIRISGYGAVLKLDPSIKFGSFDPVTGERFDPVLPFYDTAYYAYPYRGMINLEGNESVTIEGVELDGNNENIVLGGHWGDSQWQLEGHGLSLAANGRVTVRDVYSHNHPCDGMVLSASGLALDSPPRLTLIENFKSRYNARQGVSLVGGRNITFINVDLSYTGRAFNGAEQFLTYPAAGIDIEAEGAIIRDVLFVNPYMMGNIASGINAQSGNSARVKVIGGLIEGLLVGRFCYHFTGVTFLGKTTFGLPATNEYKGGAPVEPQDGHFFDNCAFLYDASLTEDGVLVRPEQSPWQELIFTRFRDCVIDTGSQLLPNAYQAYPLDEKSPIWENCTWNSTSVEGVDGNAVTGHFRGVNRINAAHPTFTLSMGGLSDIEYGALYLNGVAQ